MHSLMVRIGDKSEVIQGNSLDEVGEKTEALLNSWRIKDLETYILALVKNGDVLTLQIGREVKFELIPNLNLPE